MAGLTERKYNEVICANSRCKRLFLKRKKPDTGTLPPGIRGYNCITCSRKCSKEYNNFMRDQDRHR